MSSLKKLVETTKANPLDRENWVALGKALGWGDMDDHYQTLSLPAWRATAHRWLDAHFAGEQEEQELWQNLLKTKL